MSNLKSLFYDALALFFLLGAILGISYVVIVVGVTGYYWLISLFH